MITGGRREAIDCANPLGITQRAFRLTIHLVILEPEIFVGRPVQETLVGQPGSSQVLVPVNSLALNSLAVNSLAVNSLAVNSLAVNSLALNSLAVDSLAGCNSWVALV